MSMFSFSELATTNFVSDSVNYLRPYDIYKVRLTKFERSQLQGKKEAGSTYDVIAVEFTGESGVFSQNIFVPKDDRDFERGENPNTHKPMASRFEQFQFTLMQMVETINPKGAQTIKENASKLKTIDDFITLVTRALTNKSDVEVYLKLVGRNNGGRTYASLPNACLIGTDGKPKALNFISADADSLFFSAWEMQQAEIYKNAKPTSMPDTNSLPDIDTKPSENIDLSGLEV